MVVSRLDCPRHGLDRESTKHTERQATYQFSTRAVALDSTSLS